MNASLSDVLSKKFNHSSVFNENHSISGSLHFKPHICHISQIHLFLFKVFIALVEPFFIYQYCAAAGTSVAWTAVGESHRGIHWRIPVDGLKSCGRGISTYLRTFQMLYSWWRHQMEKIRVTCPFWGESTGHRWINLAKAIDAELWYFLWSVPEQTGEQTVETPVIWDAIVVIRTSL